MQKIETLLQEQVANAIQALYQGEIEASKIQIQATRPDFEGDFTVLVFPLVRFSGQRRPDVVGEALGAYLTEHCAEVARFNVVKGFCNLVISDSYWIAFAKSVLETPTFGIQPKKNESVVVEYSSPNTNKPLHLGHVRNNLLGYSVSQVLEAGGYDVKKVQIINDRGVHICKSMLAWERFGNGETPESTGMKGDHLIGKYYVEFEKRFQAEYKEWQKGEEAKACLDKWIGDEKLVKKATKVLDKARKKAEKKIAEEGGELNEAAFALAPYFFKSVFKNNYFNTYSEIGKATKDMLVKWENGDEEVRALWAKMNGWVYDGFDVTYKNLGVDFDKLYYESQTYLVGKGLVESNLGGDDSIFYKKDDNSVWIDLKDAKLDEKVVLRSDGTSMYITQDIGTASLRYDDFDMDKMVYVVGNEQEHHFKVLFEILKRLGHSYAERCYHLSYGMVNLTTGKMKSREGTVVDADDLMTELIGQVAAESADRNTLDGLSDEEKQAVWSKVALGALKFYILKIEPRKSMVFDPKQSIDLQGQTGPYIQNAYVRTQAVQRKFAAAQVPVADYTNHEMEEIERKVLQNLYQYPNVIAAAAANYNPAEVANYLYAFAKLYHQLWNTVTILDKNNPAAASFRLDLSRAVAQVIKSGGALLGMDMPDRM